MFSAFLVRLLRLVDLISLSYLVCWLCLVFDVLVVVG